MSDDTKEPDRTFDREYDAFLRRLERKRQEVIRNYEAQKREARERERRRRKAGYTPNPPSKSG